MKIYKVIIAVMLGATVLSACTKNEKDNEKPVITVTEPANNFTVSAGGEIHFEAEFTDNEALAQYSIDIHGAEGHSHGKMASEWTSTQIVDISGTSKTVHEHIDVAVDADTGDYHMVINCIDAAGNEADFVEIDFEIN